MTIARDPELYQAGLARGRGALHNQRWVGGKSRKFGRTTWDLDLISKPVKPSRRHLIIFGAVLSNGEEYDLCISHAQCNVLLQALSMGCDLILQLWLFSTITVSTLVLENEGWPAADIQPHFWPRVRVMTLLAPFHPTRMACAAPVSPMYIRMLCTSGATVMPREKTSGRIRTSPIS